MEIYRIENSIIGSCLLERGVFTQVRHLVKANEFQDYRNEGIWYAMDEMYLKSQPIDFLTVCEKVGMDKDTTKHMAECCKGVASTVNVEYYCQILIDNINHQEQVDASREAAENPDVLKTEEWREKEAKRQIKAHERIIRFKKADDINTQLSDTLKAIEAASKLEGLSGIPTGSERLDEMMGGWQKGYYIIAGRPSMGKTARMLDFLYHAASSGKSIYVASLEMSVEQLTVRLLSRMTSINSNHMRTREAKNIDMVKVQGAASVIGDWKITIDDRPRMSMDTITAGIKEHERKFKGVDMIFIDYLGLIASEYRTGRNKTDEVTEISARCQGLVKEFDCSVLVLSQLNRGVEARGDKRPLSSDLRDSGAIEQDADMLMMIYRPSFYYNESFDDPDYKEMNPDDYKKLSELIIRKNRNGEIGVVKEYVDLSKGAYNSSSDVNWNDIKPLPEDNIEF
jgi:replicative DNA helicase